LDLSSNFLNVYGEADKLTKISTFFFFKSERSDKMPNDPVARFHLGNGASLEQINFLGDVSPNGIELSGGLMVNYLYDLEKVEQNHETFVSEKKINISNSSAEDIFGDEQTFPFVAGLGKNAAH